MSANHALRGISTVLVCSALWAPGAHAKELLATFTDQCPTTAFPKPGGSQAESLGVLATSILTSVAGSLMDTGIAALKKKVNPGNAAVEAKFLQDGLYAYTSSDATSQTGTVSLSPNMECLVVALGAFPDSNEQSTTPFKLPFKPDVDPEVATQRLKDSLDLTDSPNLMLYMEAAKRISADRTAVTWQPVRLYVGDYLNDSVFAGKARSMQVELRIYKPGVQQPFYSQEFSFDNVQKPLDKGPGALDRHNAGTWGILPAPPNIPAKFNATISGRPFDPFTLEVRIVEAPKPFALAVAFADALEKNKEDIKKQVTEAIDSDAKKKSELSGEGTTLTAISEYLAAFSDAKGKCTADKKKEQEGKLTCTIAMDKARIAQQKADLACKTQGVSSCSEMPEVKQADAG